MQSGQANVCPLNFRRHTWNSTAGSLPSTSYRSWSAKDDGAHIEANTNDGACPELGCRNIERRDVRASVIYVHAAHRKA